MSLISVSVLTLPLPLPLLLVLLFTCCVGSLQPDGSVFFIPYGNLLQVMNKSLFFLYIKKHQNNQKNVKQFHMAYSIVLILYKKRQPLFHLSFLMCIYICIGHTSFFMVSNPAPSSSIFFNPRLGDNKVGGLQPVRSVLYNKTRKKRTKRNFSISYNFQISSFLIFQVLVI